MISETTIVGFGLAGFRLRITISKMASRRAQDTLNMGQVGPIWGVHETANLSPKGLLKHPRTHTHTQRTNVKGSTKQPTSLQKASSNIPEHTQINAFLRCLWISKCRKHFKSSAFQKRPRPRRSRKHIRESLWEGLGKGLDHTKTPSANWGVGGLSRKY